MVSACLPSDALLQHLLSYLGSSYLGRGVSLHGCSSKAQLLLLALVEGISSQLPISVYLSMYLSIQIHIKWPWGFPGGASGKETAFQCRRHKRGTFDLWVGKIPWRRGWKPSPGKSMKWRSVMGYRVIGSQRVRHD